MSARGADIGKSAIIKPRRRGLRVLGIAASLLVVGVLAIVYSLQPTQLTAILLGRASSALKLDVKTSGPGSYAFRPEARLVMPGLSAAVPGADKPFFRSEQVEVALPWATLRGRSTAISSIVLKSPDIDVKAMQAWLATQPPSNKPFKFPTLTRGLQIDDGLLRASSWRVEHLDVALPSLADGKPVSLEASGNLLRGAHASKFALDMTATPAGVGTGLRLDDARIILKADGELPSLAATGSLRASDSFAMNFSGSLQRVPATWARALDSSYAKPGDAPFSIAVSNGSPFSATNGGATSTPVPAGLQWRFTLGDAKRQPSISLSGHVVTGLTIDAELHGQLSRWPDAWPGLPAAIAATSAPIVFHASYRGSIFLNDPAVFDVERGDAKLQGKARIADVRAWIERKDASAPLPPIDATLTAPQLDVDGMQLRGVRIDLHDDAPVSSPPAKPAVVAPKS